MVINSLHVNSWIILGSEVSIVCFLKIKWEKISFMVSQLHPPLSWGVAKLNVNSSFTLRDFYVTAQNPATYHAGPVMFSDIPCIPEFTLTFAVFWCSKIYVWVQSVQTGLVSHLTS